MYVGFWFVSLTTKVGISTPPSNKTVQNDSIDYFKRIFTNMASTSQQETHKRPTCKWRSLIFFLHSYLSSLLPLSLWLSSLLQPPRVSVHHDSNRPCQRQPRSPYHDLLGSWSERPTWTALGGASVRALTTPTRGFSHAKASVPLSPFCWTPPRLAASTGFILISASVFCKMLSLSNIQRDASSPRRAPKRSASVKVSGDRGQCSDRKLEHVSIGGLVVAAG